MEASFGCKGRVTLLRQQKSHLQTEIPAENEQ
jgi:hypothetical protein